MKYFYGTLFNFQENGFGINEHSDFMREHLIQETLHNIPSSLIEEIIHPYLEVLEGMTSISLDPPTLKNIYFLAISGQMEKYYSPTELGELLHKHSDEMFSLYEKVPFKLKIFFGDEDRASRYYPESKYIQISVAPMFSYFCKAYTVLYSSNPTFKDVAREALSYLNAPKTKIEREFKSFIKEMAIPTLKGSIVHELSHWFNDAKNNFNLSNTVASVAKKTKLKSGLARYYKVENINFSHAEIDAQVHAIAELKKEYTRGAWNSLTFVDLSYIYTPIWSIIKVGYELSSGNALENYLIGLTKRLHREHLLGAKMDYSQIFKEPEWYN